MNLVALLHLGHYEAETFAQQPETPNENGRQARFDRAPAEWEKYSATALAQEEPETR